jgi:hypothetical protein
MSPNSWTDVVVFIAFTARNVAVRIQIVAQDIAAFIARKTTIIMGQTYGNNTLRTPPCWDFLVRVVIL